MEPRQRITQTQRMQLNLRLHTSIRVLRADAEGLTRFLEEQAAENPALVLRAPQVSPQDWLPRWAGLVGGLGGMPVEGLAAAPPSLMAHVTAAIDRLFPRGPARRIALALAEALEPSGWLGIAPETLAQRLRVAGAEVEAVLAALQQIEPAGLFARDLRDCLRLQAVELGQADAVMLAVIRHIDVMAAGEVARIARMADTTEADVMARFRLIRSMNPKPGTQFSSAAAPVREPDLIARRDAEGWVLSLNRSALPDLRVEPGRGAGRAAARGIERMVAARNHTLLRLGREVLRRQQAAFEHGLGALEPMTMAEAAGVLDLHESTVSRIVAGASLDTPRGTWWLRALFSRRMGDGPGQSGAALRARLAELVAAEDAGNPLSDDALAERLGADGAQVARRTVAKYRHMLDIPPAYRRRRRPLCDRKGRVPD